MKKPKLKFEDYSRNFDSPWDFMDAAKRPPNPNHPNTARSRGEGGDEFVGGTLPDSIKLATQGWSKAPNLSKDCAKIIAGASKAEKESTIASVSGAFLDIGAFVSGEPECFQEFTPVETPKVMKLGFNIMISCIYSKKQIAWKGAVMMAVASTLEMSGCAVEIDCIIANKGRLYGSLETIKFPLKRAGERVDENQLAYWCCHDSALRQIYFSYQDTQSDEYGEHFDYAGGRGSCTDHMSAKQLGVDYLFKGQDAPPSEAKAIEYYKEVMTTLEKQLAS